MEEILKQLGLNSYEREIYAALLGYGKMNAKTIAEKTKIPPTAVYPALQKLNEEKLIQIYQGKIREFAVLPPKIALDSFIERKKKTLSEVKDDLILKAEQYYQSKVIQPVQEVVRVFTGRESSRSIYFEALKWVEKTYYIVGWKLEAVSDKYEFLHKFEPVLKRGVDVRIILVGSREKQKGLLEEYKRIGIKLKYLPLENFSLFIADEKECKITIKDKLPERINVQIVDRALARAMENYFLTLWEKAEKI